MNNIHIISQNNTLLDALKRINSITNEPLVLFAIDELQRMKGTLTDGDIRRALIRGISVASPIKEAIHRNFNYLRKGVNDNVVNLHRQRELKMKLVPILDDENHIVEVINLEKYCTKLPVDAVLMAGGKGERLRPLTEKNAKTLDTSWG